LKPHVSVSVVAIPLPEVVTTVAHVADVMALVPRADVPLAIVLVVPPPGIIGMLSRLVPLLVRLMHAATPPVTAGSVVGVYPLIVGDVGSVNVALD
jgi:hypothetical protein